MKLNSKRTFIMIFYFIPETKFQLKNEVVSLWKRIYQFYWFHSIIRLQRFVLFRRG